MKVYLGDIVPTSTLDWPGRVVMSIFLRGCPFKCPYCSNSKFIEVDENTPASDTQLVKSEMDRAKDFIDGIVLSGGEPYQQPEAVEDIALHARSLGLLVGTQTNGAYPERIKGLSDNGLLDGIFLDVKAPLTQDKYCKAMGFESRQDLLDSVNMSVKLCGDLRKDKRLVYYEARTTVFKGYSDTPEELKAIASSLSHCDAYVVQQGRPELAMDENIKLHDAVSREQLIAMAKEIARAFPGLSVKVRTLEQAEERILPD